MQCKAARTAFGAKRNGGLLQDMDSWIRVDGDAMHCQMEWSLDVNAWYTHPWLWL